MKRLTLCLLPFFCLSFTTVLTAQLDAGLQLVAGSEINNALGLKGQVYYRFNDDWRAGINYINYFDGYDFSTSQKVIEWNANANYVFTSNDENIAYALAGFNYTRITQPITAFSSSEVGWNIGVGGRFGIGEQIAATTEIKYIIGNAHQLVLGIGVAYLFE